jgi:hypothetical protein
MRSVPEQKYVLLRDTAESFSVALTEYKWFMDSFETNYKRIQHDLSLDDALDLMDKLNYKL